MDVFGTMDFLGHVLGVWVVHFWHDMTFWVPTSLSRHIIVKNMGFPTLGMDTLGMYVS
jgi:hypothetical protein